MEHDDAGGVQPRGWLPGDAPAGAPAPSTGTPAGWAQPAEAPVPQIQPAQAQYASQPYAPQPYTPQPYTPQSGAAQPVYGAQPYGPPGTFPPQQYYGQPPQPSASTPALAIVGLVLAFIVPPVGLVLSIIALVRIRRRGTLAKGRGLAIGGMIVGIVASIAAAGLIVLVVDQAGKITGARDAFERMQGSLVREDCDGYMASTTATLREQIGVVNCDDFAQAIDLAGGGSQFDNVPVTGVEIRDEIAIVTTLERLPSEEAGGTPEYQHFDYTVIQRDGTWLVDAIELSD